MPYNVKKLRQNTWDLIFNLLSVGIKAENIFVQSLIPEHAELCWIFNCFCSHGQLSRMTQFKDKSSDSKDKAKGFISAGLFDYPVLQAADILIYRADYVPIGKDQMQHLELTRNIAERFNNQVGKEYFVLPEGLYTETPKIASTADPTRKMSKSAGEKHHINVFGDEARIRKQVKSAVTDAGDVTSNEMSPGVANLFSILKASDKMDEYNQLKEDFDKGQLKYAPLKEVVADALVEQTTLFKERKAAFMDDKKNVKNAIKASSAEIRKIAQETIKEVKDLTGLLNVRF